MILTNTGQSLTLVLGGTPSTEAAVTVDYVAFTSSTTTPSVQLSTTNGTSGAYILSAPPSAGIQYKVNGITVVNIDSSPIVATISIDSGTLYPVAQSMVIGGGSTLQFTDTRGWFVINSAGQILSAQGSAYSDVRIYTANDTWNKPANCSLAYVEVVGGGGGGSGGAGGAAFGNRGGGGGGGGGNRLTSIFQISDLASTISVTVGGIANGGTGGTSAFGSTGTAGNISSFGTLLYGYAGGGATSGGGGGGGGTSSGATSVTGFGALGGSAFAVSNLSNSYATNIGAPGVDGGSSTVAGNSSYLGGGGGGGGAVASVAGNTGGSSYYSAAGGGGGGGVSSANPGIATAGGAGGNTGGSATVAGGGGAGGAVAGAGVAGATGSSIACGKGGGGGGANNSGTAGRGGDGGFPGGGGGGGGGGTPTGGRGGDGAAGRVVVYCW